MVLDCQLGDDGQPPKSSPSGKNVRRERRKFVGFSEHLKLARVKRETRTGPDSWLTRKFAVFLVAGIYCYAYYVFVVRLCVKMVRMEEDRLGNRAQGIIYLVIFHVLFCMFNWSYWGAVTTPPGFARDYVPKTDPPLEQAELVVVEGHRFENLPESPRQSRAVQELEASQAVAHEGHPIEANAARSPSPGPTYFSNLNAVLPHPFVPGHSPTSDTFGTRTERFSTGGETAISSPSTSTIPLTYPPRARTNKDSNTESPTRVSRDLGKRSFLHFPAPPEDWEPAGPKLLVDRIPPQVPVLTGDYRYNVNEGILRPYRSHKCRHCDAVVLKMDHHCPWVGGCVGARNYKFFYNFLQYSYLYTLFVTISLILANTLPLHTPARPHPSIDGQQIAIIILAGLFAVFTSALFAAHTRLILLNMTTIEEMGMNRMSARERSALDRTYGFWGLRGKKMTTERWDAEWGRLGREGNLWWLGSARANWEATMGKAKLGWFLPIRAKPVHDDGLSYVPNPRFSKEGLWRIRKEWPKELR